MYILDRIKKKKYDFMERCVTPPTTVYMGESEIADMKHLGDGLNVTLYIAHFVLGLNIIEVKEESHLSVGIMDIE